MPKWIVNTLMSIRFLGLFIILFLLLSPVFRYLKIYFEEPLIIIAYDNSESLQKFRKSGNYDKILNDFAENISGNYKVKNYLFGEKLSENNQLDFSEQETDFEPLFEEIAEKYTNYNIGALIIASDGIYNKGTSPVYGAKDMSFPVYTIALGDTSRKRDIIVKDIYSNKIAFIGDNFPVEVIVDAYGFNGETANLKIFNQGKEIKNIPLTFNSQDFSSLLKFELPADAKGLQTYIFKIEGKKGEFGFENNVQEQVIDIIDNKKKILILSHAVHPDIAAIQNALKTNRGVIVDYFDGSDFTQQIVGYQLVIFHQLPTVQNNLQKILKQLNENQIPALFIFGQNADLKTFNSFENGVEIVQTKKLFEQAVPEFNPSFMLFETDDEFKSLLKEFSPLNVPFADYKLSSDMNIMLYQKIKGISTKYPLIVFSQTTNQVKYKYGVILGDGIWQWRIKDYEENENHKLFDDFMNKVVNYLAIDIKKERFMVYSKRVFKENEDVVFSAEFYNESFELMNLPEIEMIITNSDNKEYRFQFSKQGKSYFLNSGQLPAGNYRYTASLNFDNVKFQKSGEFKVAPLNIEHIDLSANHMLLKQLASQTGGKMFYPNEINKLAEELKNNESIKKVSHSVTDLVSLIELKWLLFLIALLLSVEWFIRKYFGAY